MHARQLGALRPFAVLALTTLAAAPLARAQALPPIEVAFTVDDLPSHGDLTPGTTRQDIVERFVAAFARHHVPEVYGFVNGTRLTADPVGLEKVLTTWVGAGLRLGNHTYSHLNLETVGHAAFEADVVKNEPLLTRLAPNSDTLWLRFPYLAEGATDAERDEVRNFLFKRGYKLGSVTFDFQDYAWNDPYVRCVKTNDQDAIAFLKKSYLESALAQLKRSSDMAQTGFGRPVRQTLLMHIGIFDSLMLDDLLTAFEQNGVHFITLEDAHDDGAYGIDPTSAVRGRRNFLDQMLVHFGVTPPELHQPLDQLAKLCGGT